MLPLVPLALAEELSLPRLPDARILLDGRADEAAWAQAVELPDPPITEPSADSPTLGSMRTRIVCDDRAIYVHFAVSDPEPGLVRAGLGRRDTRDDDTVGISLDPAGDGRRAYLFLSTAIGVQLDAVLIGDTDDDDFSWDAVWRSAGHRTAGGYEVEMAIPWEAAHISGSIEHIGLMISRWVPRVGHLYLWPAVETNTPTLPRQAHASGPGALPRRAGLEVLPELSWSYPEADTGRLGWLGFSPGLTLRYTPGASFGAVGTFNPDFSQLESDATQIDVNQRHALSYDEKRPFFLEGQDWFAHPVEGVVYTRSMNAPLYGARVNGEAGPLGLALLHTLDVAPPPSVNEGGGWTAEQLDGQAALATVGRGRLSLGGDSSLGLFASDRTVLETELYNRLLGLDSTIRVNERLRLTAAALASATTFDATTAPVLAPAGHLGALWSSEHLYVKTALLGIAPGFRQENGFFTQEDLLGGFAEAHYNLHPSGALPLLALEPFDVWSYWRLDQAPRERAWDPSLWAQFGNGAFLKLDGHIAGEEYDGRWIDYQNAELYAEASVGELLRASGGGILGSAPCYDLADPRAGVYQEGWVELEIQPVSRFTLSLSPAISHMTELDGAPIFLAWTGRTKAELFLDRSLWLRTVLQLEGDGAGPQAWRVEPVAGWEWTPGRAAYLGGSYGVEDEAPSWQLFAKVGWLFVL